MRPVLPRRHDRDLDRGGRRPRRGPTSARRSRSECSSRDVHHVMVVGIAGGLDPALPSAGSSSRRQVRLYPDGPLYHSHPLPSRGPRKPDDHGRAPLRRGAWRRHSRVRIRAVDMEAAGVAEACERAGVDWSVYRGSAIARTRTSSTRVFFALSKPDGSADLGAVGRYLIRDPRRAKTLVTSTAPWDWPPTSPPRRPSGTLAHS